MPAQVAVALRPPKSVAAVPDMRDVMPTAHMVIATPVIPTVRGEVRRAAAITSARTRTKALRIAATGPRLDWKNLSEMKPAANPPTMPKMHRSHPQCCTKNGLPPAGTSAAKYAYQYWIPFRNTPEVSSTAAIMSMSGLKKTFLRSSRNVKSICMNPDEASCVSKDGKPASSGVSATAQMSMMVQPAMIAAGTRNTAGMLPVNSTIARLQSIAKYTPIEISEPKIAPNTPRSRTWNQ